MGDLTEDKLGYESLCSLNVIILDQRLSINDLFSLSC